DLGRRAARRARERGGRRGAPAPCRAVRVRGAGRRQPLPRRGGGRPPGQRDRVGGRRRRRGADARQPTHPPRGQAAAGGRLGERVAPAGSDAGRGRPRELRGSGRSRAALIGRLCAASLDSVVTNGLPSRRPATTTPTPPCPDPLASPSSSALSPPSAPPP